MPTLPDKSALGFADVRSTIPGVSAPVNPVGVAMQNFGQAVQGVGGELMAAQQQADKFDAQRRFIQFQDQQSTKLADDIRNAPVGAPGFADKARQDFRKAGDEFYNSLPKNMRGEFGPKLAAAEAGVASRAQSFEQSEQSKAANTLVDDGLGSLRTQIVDAADAGGVRDTHSRVLREGEQLINDAPLTPTERAAKLRQWRNQAALSATVRMADVDIDAARRTLGGSTEGALVDRESSGNPAVVNKFGYAGLYQFGAPRLETLGVYQPGAAEDMKSWSTSPRDVAGKWSGTFNIPGFPDVKTLDDFRRSPDAQRAVYGVHVKKTDQEIDDRGLDKFEGQTVGGVPITRDGIRAMVHLAGAEGARRTLESGGKYNPADANGTTALDYARLGLRGSSDPIVAELTPEQRENVLRGINSRIGADRFRTEQAVVSDLSSIEMTGRPNDALDPQQVQRLLGPSAFGEWQAKREIAKGTYDATSDFYALPPQGIQQRLADLRPTGGEQNFAARQAVYDNAVKRADYMIKLRAADPAASVDRDPTVQSATAKLDINKPETVQAVVGARLAAQQTAGIQSPSPIPVSEARAILKPLKDAYQLDAVMPVKKGEPSRTVQAQQKLVGDLKARYGQYADAVMLEVLREATGRDKDQAEAAGEVMQSLMGGKMPGARPVRALGVSSEAAAAERAVSSASAPVAAPAQDSAPVTPMGDVAGVGPAGEAPKRVPSYGQIQILLNAPEADKPRLAGLFDKHFGAGSAGRYLRLRTAPTAESVQ